MECPSIPKLNLFRVASDAWAISTPENPLPLLRYFKIDLPSGRASLSEEHREIHRGGYHGELGVWPACYNYWFCAVRSTLLARVFWGTATRAAFSIYERMPLQCPSSARTTIKRPFDRREHTHPDAPGRKVNGGYEIYCSLAFWQVHALVAYTSKFHVCRYRTVPAARFESISPVNLLGPYR
jgi:hypothetical protein